MSIKDEAPTDPSIKPLTHAEENLFALREQIIKMRPKACCEKAIMVEHSKGASIVCSNDCEWQKLDFLLVNVMIDLDEVIFKN